MKNAPNGVEVCFSFGSNIGDKAGHVRRAAAFLGEEGLVSGLLLSSLYRTAPWGNPEQDWFVNACAVGRTRLPPLDLLARVKALEVAMGRTATLRWGPRVIDIDILSYGDAVLDTPALTLPHREIASRAFVLVPLAEIRPELRIGGRSVAALAAGQAAADVVLLPEEPSAEDSSS